MRFDMHFDAPARGTRRACAPRRGGPDRAAAAAAGCARDPLPLPPAGEGGRAPAARRPATARGWGGLRPRRTTVIRRSVPAGWLAVWLGQGCARCEPPPPTSSHPHPHPSKPAPHPFRMWAWAAGPRERESSHSPGWAERAVDGASQEGGEGRALRAMRAATVRAHCNCKWQEQTLYIVIYMFHVLCSAKPKLWRSDPNLLPIRNRSMRRKPSGKSHGCRWQQI